MVQLFLSSLLLACPVLWGQSDEELLASEDPNREILLRRVLQRHADTYGSFREAAALNSIAISGSHVQGGQSFRFQLRRKRPDLLRYSLRNDATQIEAGYDGLDGWLRVSGEGAPERVEAVSGEALEALKREADFLGPLFRLRGTPTLKAELVGSRRVMDTHSYVVRLSARDGRVFLYYMDRQTSYIVQIEELDADGNVRLQTRYRDYRVVGGFPFAFDVENRVGGQTLSRTQLNEIELNPGLLSFLFRAPAK